MGSYSIKLDQPNDQWLAHNPLISGENPKK